MITNYYFTILQTILFMIYIKLTILVHFITILFNEKNLRNDHVTKRSIYRIVSLKI